MEDNRAAALILQAHVEKFIDFSTADFYDPSWQKYCKLMLIKLDELNERKIYDMLFNVRTALLSNPKIDVAAMQEKVYMLLEDIQADYQPWLGRNKEIRNQRKIQNYEDLWEKMVGFNPKNRTAVRAWEQHISDRLKLMTAKQQAEMASRLEVENNFRVRAEQIKNKRLQQRARK